MKKMQNSTILKTIIYILIPFLVLNIIVNAFSVTFYESSGETFHENMTYFETEQFANSFLNSIYIIIRNNTKYGNEIDNVIQVEEQNIGEINNINEEESIKLALESESNIHYITNSYKDNIYEFVIIDENGVVKTNIKKTLKTDTLEKLKEYIQNKQFKWIYKDSKIETNIEKLQYESIAYNELFEKIKKQNCTIYASIIADENSGELYAYHLIYKLVNKTYEYATTNIVLSSIILIISIIYIIVSIGHKKGNDGIYTNMLDKIPLEIVFALGIIMLVVEIIAINILLKTVASTSGITKSIVDLNLSSSVICGIIMYITLAIIGVTIIRRIKAKSLIKSTLTYKIIKWLKTNTTDVLFANMNTTLEAILLYGGFIILQCFFLVVGMDNTIFLFMLIILWAYAFKKILTHLNGLKKLRNKIKDIYNGEESEILYEDEFIKEQKEVARELNDISGGLSNAIKEAMKSERLKTELITNVSHDIKTPLTSIINYVDLMKKEKIENEKVKEYLGILDSKSQRLKKLTEDLVEASKASSGNIKLNIEKLNLKELITQVSGEFGDKFEKRGLKLIEQLPDEEIYIQADSRYIYRILENVYVNISKYALENSRVYIDVTKEEDKVQIQLKNTSQDRLNISVDELMQRFVRGDSTRTTEGSGLGISIAKSLTELQNGKFEIYLDGDLFKVIIEFKIV